MKWLPFKSYTKNNVRNYYLIYIIMILHLVMEFVSASLFLKIEDISNNDKEVYIIALLIFTLFNYLSFFVIFMHYLKVYRKKITIYRGLGISDLNLTIFIICEMLLIIIISLAFGFIMDSIFNNVLEMKAYLEECSIGKVYGFSVLSVAAIMIISTIILLTEVLFDSKRSYGRRCKYE